MAFRHRYPTLMLKVIEGGTWQLQKMLENGELDLSVIVAETLPDSLQTQALDSRRNVSDRRDRSPV